MTKYKQLLKEIKSHIDAKIEIVGKRINKWDKEKTCSFIEKEIKESTISDIDIVDSILDILYDMGVISRGCGVVVHKEFFWIDYIEDRELFDELKTQEYFEEYFGEYYYLDEEESDDEGVADIDFEKYEIDAETLYHHCMEEIEEGK